MGWISFRLASICGLGAVAISASAQDVDRKVSFSMPASRASVLLPALGKVAGISLTATSRMSEEVLIINVHDVTLRDLMAKIADVSQGEWKPSGGGFELSGSSSIQTMAERNELQLRGKLIDDKLNAEVSRIAKLPAFDANEAAKMAAQQEKTNDQLAKAFSDPGAGGAIRVVNRAKPTMSGGSPSERGIIALLSIIGGTTLASLADGQRVVFSSNPTRVQTPLPRGANEPIEGFVKNAMLLATATQKTKADDTRLVRISGMNGGEMGNGNPALGLGKAILSVKRQGNSLRASLIVADPNRATIVSGQYMLFLDRPAPAAPASDGNPPIALSPLASEFASAATPSSGGGTAKFARTNAMIMMNVGQKSIRLTTGDPGVKPVPISDALRARLADPEKFDPQSLAVTEGMNAAAEAKKENLVADLPDDAILPVTQALSAKATVSTLLTQTLPRAGVDVTEKDGWLVAMSKTPAESRLRRINRAAFGKVTQGLNSRTCLRLMEVCDFALHQPKAPDRLEYDGITMGLLNAAGANDALDLLSQADVLRFFGSLTPAHRSVLEAGGTVALGTLTPVERSYLTMEVFQSTIGPSVNASPRGLPAVPAFGFAESLDQERTEYLAAGIPANGTFSMKIERRAAALGLDAEGKQAIYTTDMLASRLYQAERGDMSPFGAVSKIDKYLPATQTQIGLHFEFEGQATMDRSITDTFIDRSQAAVAYEGLPSELKTQIDEALQTMRTSLGGVKINLVGAPKRNIPPQP